MAVDRVDPQSPLQVGNGTFAVAVDVTGLQTFPEAYPAAPTGTLLGTQATWGWHSMPNPDGFSAVDALRDYATPHGTVAYLDLGADEHDGPEQSPAETWLRGNPHRLDLGRIGLYRGGSAVGTVEEVAGIDQVLDLWHGTIHSRFALGGTGYTVATAVHPVRDALGVVVTPTAAEQLGLRLRFPYANAAWGDAADWSEPDRHRTDVWSNGSGWVIVRVLDGTRYELVVFGDRLELTQLGPHDLALWRRASPDEPLDVVVEFLDGEGGSARRAPASLRARLVLDAAARHWQDFWSAGAAVELAASDDSRALELERRVVLSQYLTTVNGSGALPPAETGLMVNSWRGNSHLEMHALHSAQFALWGRPAVLARQLDWYRTALPLARETAARQRHRGARWPKQVDPSGRDTPSSIGPFLVWQQPQPILLAELLYRAEPTAATVERWRDLVDETAEFMASFVTPGPDGFGLGPPIVPAQECYVGIRRVARNPTFELALWAWALDVACRWRERIAAEVPERWRVVAAAMAAPHRLGRGKSDRYAALASPPYLLRTDHPSHLAALGYVPATSLIDPVVMARTFDDVLADWDWTSTWGWDYPVTAMTATRLGRPTDAVDALFADTVKNRYLPNGHNRQSAELPIYLPGNGSLLWAVALMAAGWDGAADPSPGFAQSWRVAHEGLMPLP